MLFNSFEFLFFLPIVSILFFLLPHQFRIIFLLVVSCIFYCYFIPIYLLLLLFIIVVDYFAGIKIEDNLTYKKYWLIFSITANLGILAIFKYYNFFITNFNELFGTSHYLLKIILPIGLSFHTFQAMAYTIEVYRGKVKAERSISTYALYVLFYPQLVAGPIERPQNLLPQFHKKQIFSSLNLLTGLRLILWGYFKKLVIADNLSQIVDEVYKAPLHFQWYIVLLSIFAFSIQIYCDFSGYTDIARGSAKIVGIDLMINFNRPLLANSIRNFWQRWHISLSTWFRDYVYIPLGGNKKGKAKQMLLIFIVFTLSGFWHGAGWNFIIWGGIHAFFLILSTSIVSKKITNKFLENSNLIVNGIKIIFVNIIVAYAFVFFRNDSIINGFNIIKQSINLNSNSKLDQFPVAMNTVIPQFGNYTLLALFFYIIFLFLFEYKNDASITKMNKYPIIDTVWFAFVFISIFFYGVFTKESFIYFQF